MSGPETVLPASVRPYIVVIILAVIALICKFVLDWLLKDDDPAICSGQPVTMTLLVTSLAEDKGLVKIIGLAIANGFAALAGGVLLPAEAGVLRDLHRNRNHGHRPRKRDSSEPSCSTALRI